MNETHTNRLDTSRLERVGGQRGSNFAGIYLDSNGVRFYVKELESPMLAKNEWVAAKLYQLAGAPTLTYIPTAHDHQVTTLWLELDKQNITQFSELEITQAQHWFAVHAWTANWDAIGLLGDNQGVFDGKVMTLDVGGALQFRAHGDPKGKAFGDEVIELETLTSNQDNRHAYALFSSMTASQVMNSLQVVHQLDDTAILETIREHGGSDKLARKMVNRKHSISEYLHQLSKSNQILE